MILKKIDKYLVKQFLQTTLFGLIAFILVFVLIDFMEHIDNFIREKVPTKIIWEYYFVFIPEIIRLMLPVSVLLAGLFTTGKMSNQNELTAMKSSGISIYRYIMPFIITGFIISLAAIYFGGYIVPTANRHKISIEQEYMRKNIVSIGRRINFQDSETRIVTIQFFDHRRRTASDVIIQDFSKDDHTKMVRRIDSPRMFYDSSSANWVLTRAIIRHFEDKNITVEKVDTFRISDLSFKPADILKKQLIPSELTLSELKEYSAEQKRTGNDPTRIEIEYHSRIAFAFAALIVVFFGVPLSVNKRKGGLAIQFGISLLITFLYLVFMKISQAFGKNGVLDPILTAWAANILFLILAIGNLIRVRK